MTNIKEFLKFGNHLADNSRKISLKFFNKKINIQSKSNIKFVPGVGVFAFENSIILALFFNVNP